jgi:hypothetical protein
MPDQVRHDAFAYLIAGLIVDNGLQGRWNALPGKIDSRFEQSMSIRQKTLASVGIIVMALLAVLTTTTYFSVAGRFARLEIKEVEARVHRVRNELDATLANLEATAADWTLRDDSYRFVQNADPAFVANNLVDSRFLEQARSPD